jgi:probable rRNA maturation factor
VSAVVEVVDHVGLGQIQRPVVDLATAVLDAEGVTGGVVVAFVEVEAMAVLNNEYRGLEGPTDVLSFRYADNDAAWPDCSDRSLSGEEGATGSEAATDLGEVVVCPAVVRSYATEERGDPGRQLGWTLIHGILHLLGYDHEVDDGDMRRREQELLGVLERLVEALPAPRGTSDG